MKSTQQTFALFIRPARAPREVCGEPRAVDWRENRAASKAWADDVNTVELIKADKERKKKYVYRKI